MLMLTHEKRALKAAIDAMDQTIRLLATRVEQQDRLIASIKAAGVLNSRTLEVHQHQIAALRDHDLPTIPREASLA